MYAYMCVCIYIYIYIYSNDSNSSNSNICCATASWPAASREHAAEGRDGECSWTVADNYAVRSEQSRAFGWVRSRRYKL